jgi:hypothetical protein
LTAIGQHLAALYEERKNRPPEQRVRARRKEELLSTDCQIQLSQEMDLGLIPMLERQTSLDYSAKSRLRGHRRIASTSDIPNKSRFENKKKSHEWERFTNVVQGVVRFMGVLL